MEDTSLYCNIELKDKPYLVLDLDETLISKTEISKQTYVAIRKLKERPNFLCIVSGSSRRYAIVYRPNLFKFLIETEKKYNLHVYTNSCAKYCMSVINAINERIGKPIFCKVKYRTNEITCHKFLHHLSLDKTNTVIVDDLRIVWKKECENVLCIKRFDGCSKDNELVKILELLKKVNCDQHFSDKVMELNIEYMAQNMIENN